MMLNKSHRLTYSNIKTKIKSCKLLKPEYIITRTNIGMKRNGEPVYDMKLNVDFWKNIKEPIDVVLDEAHTMVNARKSMSKVNIIMTDWLALIRRVLGSSDSGYGELVLISQLANRIDIIAREMATNVRWHICHYQKTCKKCMYTWGETSDTAEPQWVCPVCGHYQIKKHSHQIEVFHFQNMFTYQGWKEYGMKSYHRHYIIEDIENYFNLYNTLSWENMSSEFY